MNLYRVYVNKKINSEKADWLWASFRLRSDAEQYTEKLRDSNPTWAIRLMEPGQKEQA